MNDKEKEYLKLFWNDIDMREAVRKALFLNLDDFKISSVGNLTNEEIGAEARAILKAKEILQSRFNSISQFGTLNSKVDTENPAL